MELEAGNTAVAIRRLEKSKRRDPDFAPAYLALAAALAREGRFDAVADHLRQYLDRNPDHYVARLYLAECLLTLERRDDARSEFLAFVRRAEAATESGRPPALADSHERGRLAHAYARLTEIAEHRDDVFEMNLFAGKMLYLEALPVTVRPTDAARSSTAMDRSTPIASDSSSETTRLVDALERLQSAKRERPADPTVRVALARVLQALGETESAQRLNATVEAPTVAPLPLFAGPEESRRLAEQRISRLDLDPFASKR